MGGAALMVIGLWVILQTTKGPLAEKLGLVAGSAPTSSSSSPTSGPNPGQTGPVGGGTSARGSDLTP